MSDEHDTQSLRKTQLKRESEERRQADVAPDEDETAQHQRRAEKAQYLGEKLKDRERSEREQS
jgi:hypothetical protein